MEVTGNETDELLVGFPVGGRRPDLSVPETGRRWLKRADAGVWLDPDPDNRRWHDSTMQRLWSRACVRWSFASVPVDYVAMTA